ncbi:universal stress protein [Zunongwangia pacifica]|mgnify:FL=1|uniref:Universal stress protein n=1 Tax=Zunongwangia pacifica TaxID=2911062 RepID=A0A9X1ZRS4_9FLAO|nr:universal stress protein [Zunongwangia pacifica]MCL6219852.1 universal stress protein [Zunongwangia pacifica]
MLIKNILVAVDFNETVGEMLTYAESFAEKFEAKVWLVHVAEPDPDFIGYNVGPQYIRNTKAEEFRQEHRMLQQLCDSFIEKNIASEALLIQGSTVETILEEAKKLKTDMMIVGTHKHGFFYHLFAESVAMEILKQSKIPVFTVPIEE